MRRILFSVVLISITGIANGSVFITVNDEINPEFVTMNLNEVLNIGLWGDGNTIMGVFFLGLDVGNEATLDISSADILYPGISKWVEWEDDKAITDYLNVENPCILVQLSDPVMPPGIPRPLEGQLVEDIRFSPQRTGMITLGFFDGNGSQISTQPIDVQQIYVTNVPEPATIAMLGLGALILKRRRNI